MSLLALPTAPRRLAGRRPAACLALLALLTQIACSRGGGDPSLAAVHREIESARAAHAPDSRVAWFQVRAEMRDGRILLAGETDRPAAKDALLAAVRRLGIEADDAITLLPQADLGSRRFALVTVSVANLRGEPRHAAELTTQATLGSPLRLLRCQGDFCLVQTPDEYIGWVDRGAIEPLSREEIAEYARRDKIIYLECSGSANEAPSRRSPPVSDLVIGGLLALEEAADVEEESAAFYRARFPDGRTAYVSRSEALRYDDWLAGIRAEGAALARTARRFLGVPYLWGGTSSKGLDCSGLVKMVYFLHGIILPRDASQQAECGTLVDEAGDFTRLEPGDLLFFGQRATAAAPERVHHVGMWIGGGEYIHAFAGRVRIASADPDDAGYDERNRKRYLRARRILGRESRGVKPLDGGAWILDVLQMPRS
ncbi:MAG: C40 family peptidase [Planctomycetes bacterium]|nr:C40 family peptidase [Planctomycetota bacterium]